MKIVKIILLVFFILIILSTLTYATDDVMDSQQKSLNISSFIEEANKYTKNVFGDIDIGDLFNSAIKGEVDNSKLFDKIIYLFGKEIKDAITTIRNSSDNNSYT